MIHLKALPLKLKRLLKIFTLVLAMSSFFYHSACWAVTKQTPTASKTTVKKVAHKKLNKKIHHYKVHAKHHVKKIEAEPEDELEAETDEPAQPLKQVENVKPVVTKKPGFVAAVEKHVVDFVRTTVTTLRYSDYKLGGKKFDPARGIYVVDCSNFVDRVLQNVSPRAYTSLVNATGSDSPATQHYYDFFSELSDSNETYWNKVNFVDDLRPGDILVFRYKNSRGRETGGHVMVVMGKPMRGDNNVYYVRVADSANSGHSQDTRQRNEAGIGIGTLLLKVNPHTGKPAAYAWGVGSYWNSRVKVAMARPMDAELA